MRFLAERLTRLLLCIGGFAMLAPGCSGDLGTTASHTEQHELRGQFRFFPNRSWNNPVGDVHALPIHVDFTRLQLRETDMDSMGVLTSSGRARLSCDQTQGPRGEPSVELTVALRSLKGPDYTFVHQLGADESSTSAWVPNVIKIFAPHVQSRMGQSFPFFSATFDLNEQLTSLSGGTAISEGSAPLVTIRLPLRELDLRPGSLNSLWVAVDQGNSLPSLKYQPNAFSHCSVQATFLPVGFSGDILSHFLAGSCLGIHRPWEYASELSPLEDSPFFRAICPFVRGQEDWKIETTGCNELAGPFMLNVFGLGVDVLETEMVDVCPSENDEPDGVVNLRVDSNRDGELTEADEEGEALWHNARGAIYLPNIDSDQGFHDRLNKNDATDGIINGIKDLEDLAVMELAAVAQQVEALPKNASVKVFFENENVRIFHKTSTGAYEEWIPEHNVLKQEDLTKKQEFRIEGKSAGLDENPFLEVRAQFEAEDAQGSPIRLFDDVKLRLAPLLFHSHLDPPEQLVISPAERPEFQAFTEGMRQAASDTGIELVQYRQSYSSGYGVSKWIQDRFEAGYVSMPKQGGQQQTIRVFLFNDAQVLGSEVELLAKLQLGPNVAAIVIGDGDFQSFDMAGNFEVIPPLRGFPLGRVVRGSRSQADSRMSEFIDTQRLQIEDMEDIPVDWLSVGHIDEIVTFVPAQNARGWAMMVADPLLALNLLRVEVENGNGEALLFSPSQVRYSENWNTKTINQYLEQYDEGNLAASHHIERAVNILKTQHGLHEDVDIIRVPVLFLRRAGNRKFVAHTSDLVNGVMLNPGLFVAPKAYGPIVDGRDVFESYFEKKLAPHKISVKWIDVFKAYHLDEGELHCGSNVIRKIPQTPWWQKYK